MEKILIANWKLHPNSEKEAMRIAKASDSRNVVIVPPFPFLSQVKNVLKKASLGAQDVFYEEGGAYTGEISPLMLKSIGVSYVIIGHSERRGLGETDEIIAKKIKAALQAKLKVILCVGEPIEVRRSGAGAVMTFLRKQLQRDLKLSAEANSKWQMTHDLLVAYEPIWAIGTGKNADPKDAAVIAGFIKEFLKIKNYKLKIKVLYGGSTNSKNAKSFLEKKEIAGLLIGGASIVSSEMRAMAKIANGRNNVKIKNQNDKSKL